MKPSGVALTLLLAVGLSACGDERPADAVWATEWQREQSLVPTASEFAAGGQELCDALVGRMRSALDRLVPTPAEALDAAVEAWRDHAASLAFDCPSDSGEIERRLDELSVLAAEVDAGLDAESG